MGGISGRFWENFPTESPFRTGNDGFPTIRSSGAIGIQVFQADRLYRKYTNNINNEHDA